MKLKGELSTFVLMCSCRLAACVPPQVSETLYDLQAHTAVVVGAFPESGLVVLAVETSAGIATPPPFAPLIVNQMALDVVPATNGLVECALVAEVLKDIEPSDHVLCLHPPVEIVVHIASVEIRLMNHRAIGA